jgi:transposase-like protein
MNIIQSILAMLLGQQYWANIINTRGTDRCELCCYIFTTKEDAEQHRRDLESTASFMYVETVSFRSRRQYSKVNR